VKGNAPTRVSAAKPHITAASITAQTARIRKFLKQRHPLFPIDIKLYARLYHQLRLFSRFLEEVHVHGYEDDHALDDILPERFTKM
jgi:hypothetical protein